MRNPPLIEKVWKDPYNPFNGIRIPTPILEYRMLALVLIKPKCNIQFGVTPVVKVVKIHDETYSRLLEILHRMEKEKNQRVSFDEVVSSLIDSYLERKS